MDTMYTACTCVLDWCWAGYQIWRDAYKLYVFFGLLCHRDIPLVFLSVQNAVLWIRHQLLLQSVTHILS